MPDCLNSGCWKNDVIRDDDFETRDKSVKETLRSFLEYIEEKSKSTSESQENVTRRKSGTTVAKTKTRSRFPLSATVTNGSTEDSSKVVPNLDQRFNNENSGAKPKKPNLFTKRLFHRAEGKKHK